MVRLLVILCEEFSLIKTYLKLDLPYRAHDSCRTRELKYGKVVLKAIGKIVTSLLLRDFNRNSNLYGINYCVFIKCIITIGAYIFAISVTSDTGDIPFSSLFLVENFLFRRMNKG